MLFQKKVVPLRRPANRHEILFPKYNTMIPVTKLKTHFLACMAIGSIAIFNSCGIEDWRPVIPVQETYACEWHDSIPAYIDNVALGVVCNNCNYSFTTLATVMPSYSFYEAMDYLSQYYVGQYESLAFKWTGTILNKQCSDNTKTSYSFTLNQDNFRNKLFLQPQDMLDGLPLVRDSGISAVLDVKYSLDFQIIGVYDDLGNRGTLTWTKTWVPGVSDHTLSDNSYFFGFSPDNSFVDATFHILQRQGVRHIYIHDHFEER